MSFGFEGCLTMELGCDLQVDINGEEVFTVNKNALANFSGKFRKLFSKMSGSETSMKVILQDFPGGAKGFELVTSFCYNNGQIEITPSNIVLLNSAADFLEMDCANSSAPSNLVDQTEKFLQEIHHWNWSELLVALKQCQDLFPPTTSSSVLLEKILDSFIERLALLTLASPSTCPSSENSSSQLSSDTSSTCSTRNICWWFEDLVFLDVNLFEKFIRMMVSQKLDHTTIFKLLIFYSQSKVLNVASKPKKRKIMETVINLLLLLDRSSLSCKGLFEILRLVSRLKGISKFCRVQLERLIGLKLDQAVLDQLLVRSPPRKYYIYDVNLVLRLAEAYLLECWMFCPNGLKNVGSLMDSYLMEVAPDFHLKPSKFAALSMVLPDSARDSNDRLYQAIDLYLEVHSQLREEEKIRLCCALNYDKLSREVLKHLAENSKFPSKKVVQDFVAQQPNHSSKICNCLCSLKMKKHERSNEIGNLERHLQQMQWRVAELEKVCRKVKSLSQTVDIREPRLSNSAKFRYFPKLCSC